MTKDNQRLLKSIQEVKPVYSVQKWEERHNNTLEVTVGRRVSGICRLHDG